MEMQIIAHLLHAGAGRAPGFSPPPRVRCLIVAAPRLLRALENLMATEGGEPDRENPASVRAWRAARSARSAAKGLDNGVGVGNTRKRRTTKDSEQGGRR
jgi:hypothetical protein